ncbi:MAG: translation initiation factor IF-2 subunit gamma [Candidatus Micrarchaeia archaeon]|jgi:translation initiation factor 2 subunit 3
MPQSEINIGTIGHVDHGKTTLTNALTGKWTDTHSEELKRGITIKLGYADTTFYKCPKCKPPSNYSTSPICPNCNTKGEKLRQVSIVDAPGHETLMATVVAASSIIDGAMFVIAANEKCPQPQTVEHLAVIEAAEIKNVVIVQNKVDLVPKEQVMEHYKQIKEFIKGSSIESAPIIPVIANANVNMDALIAAIQENIPTPKRDLAAKPVMYVARSFDVNKPGTQIDKLTGGVIGGSIVRGEFKAGDEIELQPGSLRKKKDKEHYEALLTKITSLNAGAETLEKAGPGGLVGFATEIDPALAKADGLVGCVVGRKGELPPAKSEISIEVTNIIKRVIQEFSPGFLPNEPLVLGVGTNTTVGFIKEKKKKTLIMQLKKPISAEKGARMAVMRRGANNRWRLYGTATLL